MGKKDPGTIGKLVQEHRTARGFSQKALAEATGLGRVYIAQLETGDRQDPSFSTIERLTVALGPEFAAGVSAYLLKISSRSKRSK